MTRNDAVTKLAGPWLDQANPLLASYVSGLRAMAESQASRSAVTIPFVLH